MNRRGFLKGLGAVIGGLALAEAVPLGRVYSFPSKIVTPQFLNVDWITREQLRVMYPDSVSFSPSPFDYEPHLLSALDHTKGIIGRISTLEYDEEINLLSTG